MRRALVLLVVGMTLTLVLGGPLSHRVRGQGEAPIVPKYSLTVIAGVGSQLIFEPKQIRIPQVPIILNITIVNNGTTGLHTFSINDKTPDLKINVVLTNRGDRSTVEFQVNASTTAPGAIGNVFYNGSAFEPQKTANGIRFYCRPHEALGMVGEIVLATAGTAAAEDKGLFLRAYWIGVIALAAMLLWIGITYFVIKTSSRHFSDHHEHIRRGLP